VNEKEIERQQISGGVTEIEIEEGYKWISVFVLEGVRYVAR
jgi:hypothetical protein